MCSYVTKGWGRDLRRGGSGRVDPNVNLCSRIKCDGENVPTIVSRTLFAHEENLFIFKIVFNSLTNNSVFVSFEFGRFFSRSALTSILISLHNSGDLRTVATVGHFILNKWNYQFRACYN
jgi:hypothetical protein